MESNEKNNALSNRNNRSALLCLATPAPDTRCGAGRAGGSPPIGGIDITCISPNDFVLPFCGLRFWSGLAARSAYIEVIRRFVLASFVPFCRSAAKPSCLISLARLGRCQSLPLKLLVFLGSFCSESPGRLAPVSAGVKAAETFH